ncbi:MAG: rhodanese-like domain-containing protein [gamma proteobacterium symbiont of Bathyaustriella thionipta]|nr:rhodanese-like domain-containing protein [gamma proteobacterium symbiont of Bathyaustriella thionipta]MCU7950351.1 rhodanese-like domain-containing protein [gamma proteobacterium symbiont of Bathyaustriella thionipta]MCU7953720.1 rhodanese-like domain-containing protein [gamma proteobacterium symbiont of Bathyaustriella thionipta]MCU7957009.1 rhodanese-like domain-containing protein [gamma proteobacterium symbiont of Bathyaustriella thionipta]MCU7967678.1 rhodanese-like domain-containing pro
MAESDDGFPGRKLYPQVKTISKEALYDKIINDKVIVVDVRSEFEYRTLKILNAVHISAASKSFPEKLKQLRDETPKEIIFYCNGRSCYKSYKAAMKAIKYNVSNCYSYDAGVFEWALMYPDNAVLLGHSPVDKNSIISREKFKAHLLLPKDFEQQSLADNSIIYDVRDREQRRGGSGLFMFRDKVVGLDNIKKLTKIVSKAINNDSTLYFYDQKGKQVRWFIVDPENWTIG